MKLKLPISGSLKRKSPQLNAPTRTLTLPLIQFTNNGGRIEIDVSTSKQQERFRTFVEFAIQQLDLDIQKKTLAFVDTIQGDELRSFGRYFYEGWLKHQKQESGKKEHGYRSEGLGPETLKSLFRSENFQGVSGVDFGCGSGEVLRTLTQMGARMSGFDLSPFFVQEIRNQGMVARVSAIDQTLDQFENEFGVGAASQSFALATLVLDRLSHPLRFLVNFFHLLIPGGAFSIQTLLPIVPRDDGPVQNPIIYTQDENKITTGRTVEEDTQSLLELLRHLGGRNIQIKKVPYSVSSLDGIQHYTLWSFSGCKVSP